MSVKSVDKLLYLANILKKRAAEPSELLAPSFEEEDDLGTDLGLEHESVPVESDFNLGKRDDLNLNIRDFVGDLVESGVPIEAIKEEFMDALARFELKGRWEGDNIVAKKNIVNLLKMADGLRKAK